MLRMHIFGLISPELLSVKDLAQRSIVHLNLTLLFTVHTIFLSSRFPQQA
jgi:hypothetical protein